MKLLIYIYFITLFQISCKTDNKKINESETLDKNGIECTEKGCNGKYIGSEFINGKDIAHQFSNKMSNSVGKKLKELYLKKNYKEVDFSEIKMKTQGMGSGKVIYTLFIPFKSVNSKCEAYILPLTTLEAGIINHHWKEEKTNFKMLH